MIKQLPLKSNAIGALSSGLCLVHCIATPLLFLMQPITVTQHGDIPVWWKSIDFIFLMVSFFAVYWSAKHTSKTWIKYALWINLLVLIFAISNEKLEWFHLGEIIVYIPAIALIILHLYNRKYCHCNDETCCTTN